MDIKDKALAKIAAQLQSLVGDNNFIIHTDTYKAGAYTDTPKVTKKHRPHVHRFKHLPFVRQIEALACGEALNVDPIAGITVAQLQTAVSVYGLRFFGKGNTMTSRNKDGSIDILRLS